MLKLVTHSHFSAQSNHNVRTSLAAITNLYTLMLCNTPWLPSGISGSNSTNNQAKTKLLLVYRAKILPPRHHPDHHRTRRAAMQTTHHLQLVANYWKINHQVQMGKNNRKRSLFPLWLQILNISCNSSFLFLQLVYKYIVIYPFSLKSNVLLHGKSVLQIFCVLFSWFQGKN